jgi:cobalt/nickel transport system ATP-binding protein
MSESVSSDSPAVEIRGLSFRYPDGSAALADIGLRIGRGEKTAIIGPNGAGKSTLLLHLNGVLRGEGEISILGERLTAETLRDIRSKIGLVFQDPEDQLFCSTVFDDVAFGPLNWRYPKDEVRDRVTRALERVGMRGSEGKNAFHLSGGERKRVALATVLSLDPEILVLDEPSNGLDPRGRRRLIDLLRTFDTTLIIATHDLDLALDLCDRCIVMSGGRITVEGPAGEILRDKTLLLENSLELPLSLAR